MTKELKAPESALKYELATFLKKNEDYISGTELLKRAKKQGITTGKEDTYYLLEHQNEIPKEWREYYLIFPEYLQDRGRGRRVGGLDWYGGRWVLDFGWLRDGFRRSARFARPRESLDSRTLGASESLESWPLEILTINGVKYRRV